MTDLSKMTKIERAEIMLPMFTRLHHRDGRPARAIQATKAYARGEIDDRALIRARNDACRAATGATGMAAAAAWAAWRAAEEPLKTLRETLRRNGRGQHG